MKLPKAVVHAKDLNSGSSSPTLLVGNKRVNHDERTRSAESICESGIRLKVVNKLVSEKVCGSNNLIGLADPLHEQVAKTASN
jgi:hypothetical protein